MSVHEREQNYKCIGCEKAFFRKGHLMRHIKAVHVGETLTAHLAGQRVPGALVARQHGTTGEDYVTELTDQLFVGVRTLMVHQLFLASKHSIAS